MINCTISELQPLRAEPEDIDLDIVYEDEHVLVVNKPAHMVMIQKTLCFKFDFICIELICGWKISILPSPHLQVRV